MKLKPTDLAPRLKAPLPPVILVEGEETLLTIESADAVRAAAKLQEFSEREVHEAGPGFDTAVLIEARNGMSLFADKTLVELRLSKPKLDAKTQQALGFYLDGAPEDKCLLITAPKLEKGERNKDWFKQASSIGWHVECTKIYANQFAGWLANEAKRANLRLSDDGFQSLLMRVEGNALAARQELNKLRLFATDDVMGPEQINRICSDSARYGVFDFTDACLIGNLGRVRTMLGVLKAEGSDPLGLLRMLAKDIALLNQIIAHPNGINAGIAAINAFPKKKELIGQAARRLKPRQLVTINQLALRVDQSVKGQSKTPAWLLLDQLALSVAGATLPN